jgi:hypothetical protein
MITIMSLAMVAFMMPQVNGFNPELNSENSRKVENLAMKIMGIDISTEHLKYILDKTAEKPYAYILHPYDVGERIDFEQDYVWHSLKKERGYDISERGKLGVININSDINCLIGFGAPDSAPVFDMESKIELHIMNVLVEKVDSYNWLEAEVCFTPYNSSTLLIVLKLKNKGDEERKLACYHLIGRSKGLPDRYRSEIVYTKEMLGSEWSWNAEKEQNEAMQVIYSEGECSNLLCTLGASEIAKQADVEELNLDNEYLIGQVVEVTLGAEEERTIIFSLNMHSFDKGRDEISKFYGTRITKLALRYDWQKHIKTSLKKYERYPVVELPEESWESYFYSALELPQAETFNPQRNMKFPFYTLCRAQGQAHKNRQWFEGGWTGSGDCSLSLFATLPVDPYLPMDHFRNNIDHQAESGLLPSLSVDELWVEGSPPIMIWEAWNTYLWTGDREFLEETFEAGKKDLEGWYNERDRTGDGLCYFKDVIENLRDTGFSGWNVQDGHNPNKVPTFLVVPIYEQENLDLNCYLLSEERAMAQIAELLGYQDEAKKYRELADRRIQFMNWYMLYEEDKCYYGISEYNGTMANVKDVAIFFPLFAGLAPQERAEELVKHLDDPEEFKTAYPVPTLAMDEPTFKSDWHWHGPTWIQMNWLIMLGLRDYGYYSKASELAYINTKMMFDGLEETSHFSEYYDSITGKGIGLYDYIWDALPAAYITRIFFGIEPHAEGLAILPALPGDWKQIRIRELHIRGSLIDLEVKRSQEVKQTSVTVNGESKSVLDNRGIFISWNDMPSKLSIVIAHPLNITEVHKPPEEMPKLTGVEIPPKQFAKF